MKKILGLAMAFSLGLLVVSKNQAAVTFNVTGVYDSTTNENTVDRSMTTTGGNQVGLGDFKMWVSSAYTAGFGGVIEFESASSWGVSPQALNPTNPDLLMARYGIGLANTLNITNTSLSPLLRGSATDRTAISGSGYAGKSGSNDPEGPITPSSFGFGFSETQQVIGVGATVLSRQGNAGSVNVTVRFSDGTFDSVATTIQGSNATDDTFFGFRVTDEQWASGIYIVGLEFDMPHYRGIDDLAFVVAPEPGISTLLMMAFAGFFLRRKRR